ncbi:hypothetical protein [Pseudomonas aeruginosa]|uniref:hypothetical protein n=1 Tax=Pseudomonas aeruginosa TaxID=287 RepID=UPI0034E0C6D7
MTREIIPSNYEKAEYLAQLEAARNRLLATRTMTLDWVNRLDEHAASAFIQIEPLVSLFPSKLPEGCYRLVFEIHTTPKRYGVLGVSLRTESMRADLSKVGPSGVAKVLAGHCSSAEAKNHALAFQEFEQFNSRVASLRAFGVDLEPLPVGGPVLPRWFEALHAYGLKCRPVLAAAFDRFLDLSRLLDEAMFEFNSTMGPVRYRSIRCTYTLDDFDLLGPASPSLKVVTSINPHTRRRRYNQMVDFKKALKKKRIGQKLRRDLGREPDKLEVQQAIKALRPRQETAWITKDVIKACYLGRSINDVFEAQEKLVAVMQSWTALRAQLQALLPKKGKP